MTVKASSQVSTTKSSWLLALALVTPILLLPRGQEFVLSLALLSLLGLFMLVGLLRQRRHFNTEDRALQVLPRLFLFLWLPILLSAIDAADPARVLAYAKLYPLYGLMALAVVVLLRATVALRQIMVLLSWLVCLWAFDGLAQTALGIDMFNRPLPASGHAAAFFADGSRYGFYLGLFATLPLYTLYLVGANRLSHLLMTMAMVTAVLVLTSCASWLMVAWALLPYLVLVYVKNSPRPLLPLMVVPLWLGGLFMICMHYSANVQQQLELGFSLWSGDRQWQAQTSYRFAELVQMWRLTLELFGQHWLNGVGVGQFAAAFQPYLAPGATLPAGIKGSHPHQVVLEIAVSTGIIGILAFMLVWAAVWRLWQRATPAQHKLALPVLMPVAALWWPVNSHHGFYSTELAALTFFLLALAIAALTHQGESKTS